MKTKTLKPVALGAVVVDFFFVPWDNARVLRDVDGAWYMLETNRWGTEDNFRAISSAYAARLVEQAFPSPAADYTPADRRTAAGCIG